MSEKNLIKSNIFKCHSKQKKFKQRYLFDLDAIDKQYNSHSLDKEELKQKKEESKEESKKEKEEKDENGIKINKNVFKIRNIDDLEVLPLKNLQYLYSAWKSSNLIFENFEKNILDKKNFEINGETFDIITKNEKACNELKNEKFWILYIEYLKRNSKIKEAKDFLKIINLAFTYMEFDSQLLLVYYLDKIKKYNPIMDNGKIEEKDGPYINLLDSRVKNRINYLKENLSSNIKIRQHKLFTYQKEINNKKYFYEYTPISKKFKK